MNNRIHVMLTALFLSAIALSATAHQGATGIIKQRMDAMSEMGDAMKTMGDMIKGKTAYEIGTVRLAVEQLSLHVESIPDQFPDTPESKNFSMTEALPEVWASKDRFIELADQLKSQLGALKMITDTETDMPDFRRNFVKVTKACSACHDDYRKPKD